MTKEKSSLLISLPPKGNSSFDSPLIVHFRSTSRGVTSSLHDSPINNTIGRFRERFRSHEKPSTTTSTQNRDGKSRRVAGRGCDASRRGRTWTSRITRNPGTPGTRDCADRRAWRAGSSAARHFRRCSRRAQGRRGCRRPPRRRTCPTCPPASAPYAAISPARSGTRPGNKTSTRFGRVTSHCLSLFGMRSINCQLIREISK